MNFLAKKFQFLKANKLFILALFTIHGVYFACAIIFEGICTQDSDEYLQTAENLKYHFTSYNWVWSEVRNLSFYSLRPPLYGILILACKSIYYSDYTVIFIQNLMSIFIWCLTLHLSKVWRLPFRIEIPILVVLLLVPSQLVMVNSIMADVFFEFLLILCLACVIYYVQKQDTFLILIYNILLAMAVLTKPLIMYFWIPNVLFSIYLFYHKRNYLTLFSCCILPLTVFLWSARNEQKTGLFHYSSIKYQGILELNAGGVLALIHGVKEGENIRNEIWRESEKIESYRGRCEFIMKKSTDIIKEHPGLYAYCHLKGMLNFMLAMGRTDTKIFFGHNPNEFEISVVREIENQGFAKGLRFYLLNVNTFSIGLLILGTILNIVILLSLIVFIFDQSFPVVIRFFILSVVFYSIFVSGPGGYARYRVAFLPYLILTLPYFVQSIRHLLKHLSFAQTKI